jgi:hypothetical protein
MTNMVKKFVKIIVIPYNIHHTTNTHLSQHLRHTHNIHNINDIHDTSRSNDKRYIRPWVIGSGNSSPRLRPFRRIVRV